MPNQSPPPQQLLLVSGRPHRLVAVLTPLLLPLLLLLLSRPLSPASAAQCYQVVSAAAYPK